MVKDFGFTGMLCEDTESLLLIPYRADHAKDPQDWTSALGSVKKPPMLWKHLTEKVLKHLLKVSLALEKSPTFWLTLSEITLQMPGPTINILVVYVFPLTNLFLEVPAPKASSDLGLHPAHDFTAGVYEALELTAGMCIWV